MSEVVNANRIVNINPNEVFSELGIDSTNSTIQIVTQRVGTITVNPPATDAEYEEIQPAQLDVSPYPNYDIVVDHTEEAANIREETANIRALINDYLQNNTVAVNNSESQSDLIPENPKEYNEKENTSRFSGAAWFDAVKNSNVLLAGIGGIGSYVAFLLSRMDIKSIWMYDDDIVERANLSGQLYDCSSIGKNKGEAMSIILSNFSYYHKVRVIAEKFTEFSSPQDIMICGFDNMKARNTFFHSWKNRVMGKENKSECLFIDGRLAAESFQIFCITGDDIANIDRYKREFLFSDEEAEVELCSYKQTSYCANMIGSYIVNLFTNFIANTLNPVIKRDLPFKTYYDASLMYLKTEY